MECSLEKGELIRLDGGSNGLSLHCLSGTLWITAGDSLDHLIRSGGGFEIKPGCRAVAEALECCEFRFGEAVVADKLPPKALAAFVAC